MRIVTQNTLASLVGLLTTATALAAVEVRIETTLTTSQSNRPALAFDGKSQTFFRSGRGADEKDQFTAWFTPTLELKAIEALTGDGDGGSQLAKGVLEISTDGKTFKEAAKFSAGTAKADLAGESVKALRIRPTKSDLPPQPEPAQGQSGRNRRRAEGPRLVLREIILDPPPASLTVTQAMCVIADTTGAPELEAWAARARELCVQWYPKLLALLPSPGFEPHLSTRLLFITNMSGVANTSRGSDIRISASFVKRNTNDWGMVIHELTHVVQSYPSAKQGFTKPGWLVEGIADQIRLFVFEPEARRPRINPDRAKYTDSYKTTAEFLNWVQVKHDKELVKKFSAALRQGEFEDGLWKKYTGKTVDELWKDFTDELRKKA